MFSRLSSIQPAQLLLVIFPQSLHHWRRVAFSWRTPCQLVSTQMTAFPILTDSCSQGRESSTLQVNAHVREQNTLLYLYVSEEIQHEREKV